MSTFKFTPGTKDTASKLLDVNAQWSPSSTGLNELNTTGGFDVLTYPQDLLSERTFNQKDRTTFAMGFYILLPTSAKAVKENSAVFNEQESAEIVKTHGLDYAAEVNRQLTVESGTELATEAIEGKESSRLRVFRQSRTLKKMIMLYMPETLNSDLQAQYNSVDLGGVGVAVGASMVDTFKQLTSKDAVKGGDVERIITNVIGATNVAGVGKAIQAGVGRAVNPLSEVLFENMAFRSYNFDFKFVPKSEKEAQDVLQIIKTFRSYMVPEFNSDSVAGAFFSVPAFFQIKYYILKDGAMEENASLQKISACALEGVLVDNAPDGFAMHTDGVPVATRMQLQFRELEIMHRKRIQDEGY